VGGVPEGIKVLDANVILPASQVFKTIGVDGRAESWAGFSDIFRYKMLVDNGGWWVDTDFICLQPFDYPGEYFFTGNDDSVCPGLAKVPKGDPMIKWVFVEAAKTYAGGMKWGGISGLIEVGVRKFGLYHHKMAGEFFFPVSKPELLLASLSDNVKGRVNRAHAIHCWNEIWRIHHTDKNGKFEPNCLYEKFLRQYGVRA
jgi:hypothetical protein